MYMQRKWCKLASPSLAAPALVAYGGCFRLDPNSPCTPPSPDLLHAFASSLPRKGEVLVCFHEKTPLSSTVDLLDENLRQISKYSHVIAAKQFDWLADYFLNKAHQLGVKCSMLGL